MGSGSTFFGCGLPLHTHTCPRTHAHAHTHTHTRVSRAVATRTQRSQPHHQGHELLEKSTATTYPPSNHCSPADTSASWPICHLRVASSSARLRAGTFPPLRLMARRRWRSSRSRADGVTSLYMAFSSLPPLTICLKAWRGDGALVGWTRSSCGCGQYTLQ